MATTAKALDLARQLQNKLSVRIGSLVKGITFDSDSNPLIAINDGTAAAGEKNALIKVMPQSWALAKDILGNSAIQYTPHVVMLACEAPASGLGQTFLDLQLLSNILVECMGLGCKFEWYQSANGVVPVAGTFIAGNLIASVYPDMYNPLTNQQ